MRRRDALLGFAGVLAAGSALAQQKKLPRIGYLSIGQQGDFRVRAFQQGLTDLGYEDGRNIAMRYVFTTSDRVDADARAIIDFAPDVIVAINAQVTLAVRKLTDKIPIVAGGMPDAVKMGLAASLARPGGNITGNSWIGPELSAKNLQLLQEAVPGLSRVGIIVNPKNPSLPHTLASTQDAARILKIDVTIFETNAGTDLERIFEAMVAADVRAVMPLNDPWVLNKKIQLGELAALHRLPLQVYTPEAMAPGILMAYGPNFGVMYRRCAHLMDKILKGWRAGDIPFEQPTHFDFAIDMRTAKALGIEFPLGTLYRATEIIE